MAWGKFNCDCIADMLITVDRLIVLEPDVIGHPHYHIVSLHELQKVMCMELGYDSVDVAYALSLLSEEDYFDADYLYRYGLIQNCNIFAIKGCAGFIISARQNSKDWKKVCNAARRPRIHSVRKLSDLSRAVIWERIGSR